MLTRCPACATHFRVTPEQLKARSGRVRCGQCQQVFNALDVLIEEPVLAMTPRQATPPQEAVPAAPPGRMLADRPGPETPDDTISIARPQGGVPDTPSEQAPTLEPASMEPIRLSGEVAVPDLPTPTAPDAEPIGHEEPATARETSVAESAETGTAGIESAAPEAEEADTGPRIEDEAPAGEWTEAFPEPPPPPRRWPWVIGSLVALAAISLQAVVAFRVELAVIWPEGRPALEMLCDFAGCEVGLPAKVGLVGIEASDLHPDSAQAGRLALTATLKNRAPFAQRFPHLELTLTDTADKAIARRILTPADYLPRQTSIADGMPPNADIAVTVGIETNEMTASGYRLYLFYP